MDVGDKCVVHGNVQFIFARGCRMRHQSTETPQFQFTIAKFDGLLTESRQAMKSLLQRQLKTRAFLQWIEERL